MKPAELPQKPWLQLVFILGEAVLALISGGVMYVVISRVSGPALLGTYALSLSWLTLFQGVSGFGIPDFIMREVGAGGRDAGRQVVHAMALGLGSGVVALGLMLAGARLLGYSAYLVEVITVASLALFPTFINMACRAVFLALRQMQVSFLAQFVEVTIVVCVSLYLLLSGYGALALIITLVVAKCVSASISLALLSWRVLPVRLSLDLDLLIRTAQPVFTFGVGSMLGMLSLRVNMIMVSIWVDLATVGHYAAATKIMEIGMMIPNLIGQLLMTRFAYSFNTQGNRDPNRFGAWYDVVFAFVIPVAVGGWVFARPILETLFGASFGGATWILRVLLIYMVVETADNLMSVLLQAAHRQRQDVRRLAFNPLTNIVLNVLLLPILGPIGAAFGRVGGGAVSSALRYVYIAREFTAVNWLRYALKPALISIGVGTVCYLLFGVVNPLWLMVLYAVATGALLRVSSGFSPAAVKDMMSAPSRAD